jgi:hypothetical protein
LHKRGGDILNILVAVNDSVSTRNALNFLNNLAFCRENIHLTLLHVFRKPTASEELMGEKFMSEQPARFMGVLQSAKDRLAENGFHPDKIEINLATEPYSTISDGIIDQFRKGSYDMVLIGRKRMSKSEEFVMGDPSIKLLRSLEGTAVLVIKTN